MDHEEHWEKLLDRLYLSCVDGTARAALPSALTAVLGGAQVALWTFDPVLGTPVSAMNTNLPGETEALYREYYHRIDPWRTSTARLSVDIPQFGSEIVPDDELLRSEYYNDFGSRIGTFHLIGACVTISADRAAPLGRLSVIRPLRSNGFDAADASRLDRLLPHLRRVWQMERQLVSGKAETMPAWQAGAAALLDAMRIAALVADGHGRVAVANTEAERLDASGALVLRGSPPQRTIRLRDERATRRLHAALADAARRGAGAEMLLELPPAGPCRATISPLPPELAGPGLVLLMLTPQAITPGERNLRRARTLFGLSRTEAEVALELANGASPAAIAEARGVRITTIRTQLQHAIDRSGAGDLRGLAIRMSLLRD